LALGKAPERSATITAIGRYFSQASDKAAAAAVVERALQADLQNPSTGVAAWCVVGHLQFEAGHTEAAIKALYQAQALDPRSAQPALLALGMIGTQAPAAEALVLQYLQANASTAVRMGYARVLLDAKRYRQALAQVQHLTAQPTDLADAWLLQGLLEQQLRQPQAAQRSLQRYLQQVLPQDPNNTATPPGLAQAYLALAQIAGANKDFATAEQWLARIDNPDADFSVLLRRAALLAQQGQLAQARQLLRSWQGDSAAQARLKSLAETQLLRDEKQYQAAYEHLQEAIERFPSDHELLYDQAMVADKLGRMDDAERLLRQLISHKPDHPEAYNALGYLLANQGVRLAEAEQLIQKALELAPGAPHILDSLGWLAFRLGRLDEALQQLQAAYQAQPEAEIAAHLGEVLWTLGQRDAARRIWQEGLQLNAEDETLQATLQRLSQQP
jgi:tetratricopeptide (TPR) repeat protein